MARILIIDDSPTEIFVLKHILEENGYETLSATNAETGMIKAIQEQPDLILMDIILPGINGYQATRKLGKNPRTAAIPVVMVTNKDQETDRIWGMRQGARDYIIKPPDARDLINKIKTLLADRG